MCIRDRRGGGTLSGLMPLAESGAPPAPRPPPRSAASGRGRVSGVRGVDRGRRSGGCGWRCCRRLGSWRPRCTLASSSPPPRSCSPASASPAVLAAPAPHPRTQRPRAVLLPPRHPPSA
eukprot:2407790-Rhodomonas_salina.1